MSTNESIEEIRKRHRELFEKIDSSKSGKVTFDDFRKALVNSNHPLKDSPFAMEQLYQDFFNSAQNGKFWRKQNGIDFEKFDNYLTTAESQISKGFKFVDKDNDGVITRDDVSNYLKSIGCKTETQEIQKFFENLDVKKKGFVTYATFRDSLIFMPRLYGSRIQTAYKFFNDDLENLSSDGDVTVGDDIRKSIGFFLAGGISGVVSRTCTAPLDRIKVFLIARTDLSSTLLNKKSTLLHQKEEQLHKKISPQKIQSPIARAIKTIYKQGGIKAFYVGNGLNVMKVFPESAMKFGSFEAAKRLMCSIEGVDDESKLSKVSTYISGGIGGVIAQCTVYPIDTLKYRIQCASLDSKVRGFKLLSVTAQDLYKDGGVRCFYRGLIVGLGGMFPYAALDLGTFSTVKKWYINREADRLGCSTDNVNIPNYFVLCLGAASGSFGATVVYPMNLLRTRLQAQGTFAHPYTYTGFFDVAKQTIHREGVQGLFKGLVPNLAKVVPAVSISYLMYENLKVLLKLD
ncbi:Ca(2+)-binding ATP:ADP antiporter [Martiniozyma asiatica (nom. inval.)]|nr:Ca(2+)-binding ATP:ADP antiporter [Martiniozyma asiatica]